MPTRTDHNQTFDADGTLLDEEVVEVDVTEQVNQVTIEDRLRADLAAVDAITATAALSVTGTTVADVRNTAQAAIRDLQRQVKDLARIEKRLIRTALRAYESAD